MQATNDNINNILALHFAGEQLTNEQEEVLTDWVYQNQEEYKQLSQIFQDSGNAGRMKIDTMQAWNRIEQELKVKKTFRLQIYRHYLAYVACIAVLLGVSFFLMNRSGDEGRLYSNDTEKLMTYLLPDSSTVTLYPQSKVRYVADAEACTRETVLQGKAFFKVKPDADRPFTVCQNETRIRVLGTSFLVEERVGEEMTGVFVREGVVQFSIAAEQVILRANEQAHVERGRIVKSAIEHPEKTFGLHLKQKKYRNSLLSQVVNDVEEEFGVRITLLGPIGDSRITTQLKFVDLDEILSEISYICHLKYRIVSPKHYQLYQP